MLDCLAITYYNDFLILTTLLLLILIKIYHFSKIFIYKKLLTKNKKNCKLNIQFFYVVSLISIVRLLVQY